MFTETMQVALVVRDLEAALRTYVHEYGILPRGDRQVVLGSTEGVNLSLGEMSDVSIWLMLALVAGVAYLLLMCWVVVEFITAPLVDERYRVISDPYDRMPPRHGRSRLGQRSEEVPGSADPV